ncbi:MAG: protein kinase [Planctomycetes bacterium]|nr:protein kinase [Planctomycetota bacterium]
MSAHRPPPSSPPPAPDPADALSPQEQPLADLLWEAQDLFNQGHVLSVPDLRRTAGVRSTATFDDALHALEALQAELPSAAAPVLQAGDRLGGAEIRGVIGRGGMGIVYDAVEPGGARVALKILGPALQGDTVALLRFKREARLAERLDHPHVVKVLGAGQDGAFLYYKMERVEGRSLQAVLGAGLAETGDVAASRPDADACRRWAGRFAALADALHHAHQAGVIHRDVKPSNILEDEHGRLRLVDFGIARTADAETLTATSAILGTPLYMAPEQALGRSRDVGPATDVYALAATLYEVVTRRPIFDAVEGCAGLITRIASEPPLPPRRVNPQVPRALEVVLLRCLEKRPEARLASAAALGEDLRRVAAGQRVHARPVRRVRRYARQLRQRPLVAATIVALVAVATCLMALILIRSPSPWAENASASWIRIREDAWIQLFASHDAPVLESLDREMAAFAPATADEIDEARILRAWIAYKRLEPGRALERLDPLEELRSRRAAHYFRAIVLRSMWRYAAAQDEVDRAESHQMRTRLDYLLTALYLGTQQGERTEARGRCERMVEACPDYLPARIVQVELARTTGDYGAALAACGTLLGMRPGDPTLLLLQGYVHRQARQWALAEGDFRAALAADPRYEEARVALFYALRELGKDRRAEADQVLAEGLAIEPRSRWLLNSRGWERHRAGNHAGAVEDFAAALRVDPHLELAQINLGNALLALGREDEAVRFWQQGIEDPRQPPANVAAILHERARYGWRRGERAAAYRDLRNALAVCYRPLVHEKLAMYLMDEERYGEALPELDALLERVPMHKAARAQRARCRLFTGDLEGAGADIERALTLWGQDAPAWAWRVWAEVATLADDAPTVEAVFATALKKELKREERLALEILKAGWELDRPDRTAEADRSVKHCRALLRPGDPAEDACQVDALAVRVAGRTQGWHAAVVCWEESGLPAVNPASSGGCFELLRTWIFLAREGDGTGKTDRPAPAGDPLRELARRRLAGRNLDEELRRSLPVLEDGPSAWVLGEAWLALGAAAEAWPALERACQALDHGLVHLHAAEALGRLGRVPGAAAALGEALRKGMPRYSCLARWKRAGLGFGEAVCTELRER